MLNPFKKHEWLMLLIGFLLLILAIAGCSAEANFEPTKEVQTVECRVPLMITVDDLGIMVHENPVNYTINHITEQASPSAIVYSYEVDFSEIDQALNNATTQVNERMQAALGLYGWFTAVNPQIDWQATTCPDKLQAAINLQSNLGNGWTATYNRSVLSETPERYITISSENKGTIEFSLTDENLKNIVQGRYSPKLITWEDPAVSASKEAYAEAAIRSAAAVSDHGTLALRFQWSTDSLEGQEIVSRLAGHILILKAGLNHQGNRYHAAWVSFLDAETYISTDLSVKSSHNQDTKGSFFLGIGTVVGDGKTENMTQFSQTQRSFSLVKGDIYIAAVR